MTETHVMPRLDRGIPATDHAAKAIAARWGDGPVAAQTRGHVIEAMR